MRKERERTRSEENETENESQKFDSSNREKMTAIQYLEEILVMPYGCLEIEQSTID